MNKLDNHRHEHKPSAEEKYRKAVRLYGETYEPLNIIACRLGVNNCSRRDFLKRHFPEPVERRRERAGQDSAQE